MYMFLSLMFIVIGVIMFFKPDIFYQLTESWKSDTYGEPSYLFKLSTRVGSIIFMLAGFFGFVVFVFFDK